jgi:DNA polymerase-3 subunit epsilon
MTGGQTAFQLSDASAEGAGGIGGGERVRRLPAGRMALPVIKASTEELRAHEAQLDAIAAASGGRVLWRDL